MDKARIENAVKEILIAIGENPDREGLKETPKRVAKMYEEVFAGIALNNDQVAKMYDKCFEEICSGEMVVVKDIPCFSYCEHHIALMYNMKISVGYIPNGRVIGLSKIARIADTVCKRLQLQERIGSDIADIMMKIMRTENVIVVVSGEHSCMTARGIKKDGAKTKTICSNGVFKKIDRREEFFNLLSHL